MAKIIFKRIKKNSWTGLYSYPDTKITFSVGLNPHTGERKVILTKEEQEHYEKELGYAPGTLGRNSEFWRDFTFIMDDVKMTIDTDADILNELYIKMLKSKTIVAGSLDELKTKGTAEYVLYDEEEESINDNRKSSFKRKAYAKMDNMTTEQMKDLLIIIGKNAIGLSPSRIEALLSKEIEDNAKKVLDTLSDVLFKEKAFALNCINVSVIVRGSGGYGYLYKGESVGNNFDDVLDFMRDVKNSSIVLAMKESLNGKLGYSKYDIDADEELKIRKRRKELAREKSEDDLNGNIKEA